MCDKCDYEHYLVLIESLYDEDLRLSTYDFLEGVYDWVLSHNHITEAQIEAVEEIKNNT